MVSDGVHVASPHTYSGISLSIAADDRPASGEKMVFTVQALILSRRISCLPWQSTFWTSGFGIVTRQKISRACPWMVNVGTRTAEA